jgi:hypothetical protein
MRVHHKCRSKSYAPDMCMWCRKWQISSAGSRTFVVVRWAVLPNALPCIAEGHAYDVVNCWAQLACCTQKAQILLRIRARRRHHHLGLLLGWETQQLTTLIGSWLQLKAMMACSNCWICRSCTNPGMVFGFQTWKLLLKKHIPAKMH